MFSDTFGDSLEVSEVEQPIACTVCEAYATQTVFGSLVSIAKNTMLNCAGVKPILF